ncbi:hypothetical protein [Pseudoalteromonas sp. Of7M-16]|uniref:hypothetical protein n=1 Tax=Pseudoalteromonas sp. Of7M-16 TaxID=2917756 RepID=UPI001EF5A529|nr:hypothetical protein [Pseudoalteromonas sp. Of7M-16]MCG7551530.1 hypothetical protein [Pseudoalteromonas sp. Of7M-16]
MKVVVVEAHTSDFPAPFYLKQGEQVTIGKKDEEFPNWVFITTPSGEQGWAPVQYIDRSQKGSLGTLLQDYDNCEFNTTVGERLTVLFELNAWYRVVRKNQSVGWVPAHTVKVTR